MTEKPIFDCWGRSIGGGEGLWSKKITLYYAKAWIPHHPHQASSILSILATVEDRLRIPYRGGATRFPIGHSSPHPSHNLLTKLPQPIIHIIFSPHLLTPSFSLFSPFTSTLPRSGAACCAPPPPHAPGLPAPPPPPPLLPPPLPHPTLCSQASSVQTTGVQCTLCTRQVAS